MADTAPAVANAPTTRLGAYRQRHESLKNQAQGFFVHYREISQVILPRARFLQIMETNRGDKKHLRIVNNAAGLALRASVAGVVSNLTSPARPWFRLTTPDPEQAENEGVRGWLHVVEERMRSMLARTNIYEVLTAFYFDLFAFGTALFLVDEDDEQILRGYHVPVGSYVLACSERGRVDTVFRDVGYSVRQLVRKFGIANCSQTVKDAVQQNRLDQTIEVSHCIEPNEDFRPGSALPKHKRYRSVWWEKSAADGSTLQGSDDGQFLRESGFSEQRAIAARWMVIGEDAYGTNCPGMEALGDQTAIQEYERTKANVVELLARPPTAVPHGTEHASLMPGKITTLPANAAATQVTNLVKVEPGSVQALSSDIAIIVQRINRTMLADLWLMLTLGTEGSTPGKPMTAEEIRARLEEKLVQLAPVLLRLNDELLHPLVDVAFALMLRAGLIPPPPEVLQGVDLKVEFVSMLHQAQQFVQLGGIERLAGFIKSLAETQLEAHRDATVLDKANLDEMVDEYSRTLGLKPDLTLSDDKVQAIRDQRAQAAKAAQMQQAVETGADAAQKLGNTPMTGDTALTRLAGLTGPIEPSGGAGTQPGAQA